MINNGTFTQPNSTLCVGQDGTTLFLLPRDGVKCAPTALAPITRTTRTKFATTSEVLCIRSSFEVAATSCSVAALDLDPVCIASLSLSNLHNDSYDMLVVYVSIGVQLA